MKFFHVGCRVDEVMEVGPSKNVNYPTSIIFKSGSVTRITGDWRDNVNVIEKILADNECERVAFSNAISITDLNSVRVLKKWLLENKSYMGKTERAALSILIGGRK